MSTSDLSINDMPFPVPGFEGDQEAFDLAWREWRLGRFAALRVYFEMEKDLRFGKCAMCETVQFLQPSGLKGWTCTPCEQNHDAETRRLSS